MNKQFRFKPMTYAIGFVMGYIPTFFYGEFTFVFIAVKLGLLFVALGIFLTIFYNVDKKFYEKRQREKELETNEKMS